MRALHAGYAESVPGARVNLALEPPVPGEGAYLADYIAWAALGDDDARASVLPMLDELGAEEETAALAAALRRIVSGQADADGCLAGLCAADRQIVSTVLARLTEAGAG